MYAMTRYNYLHTVAVTMCGQPSTVLFVPDKNWPNRVIVRLQRVLSHKYLCFLEEIHEANHSITALRRRHGVGTSADDAATQQTDRRRRCDRQSGNGRINEND